MTDPDDALLAELASALGPRLDPPDEVLHAAREMFTWRTIDSELAALTYDSLLAGEQVLTRAAAQPRVLTFEAGEFTVEVEIDDTAGHRRLIGQIMPPQPAGVELAQDVVDTSTQADDLGRFTLDLPPEPVRIALRLRLADDRTVVTAAVLV